MKLLIVDDEQLTREGLMSSVNWRSLGIFDIFLADDGINGLETAKREKPEIILSDVRMPRMDGIAMAEKIKVILPDVCIIFMSGYSDKEYLKAAIKLKAINYVEKPLDPLEIEEAVLEAIEENKQLNRTKQSETLLSLERSSRLALLLTYPSQDVEGIDDLLRDFQYPPSTILYFTTIIVKLTNNFSENKGNSINTIHSQLDSFLMKYHLQSIHVSKHEQHIVYHIFGTVKPTPEIILKSSEHLKTLYSEIGTFFIVVGSTVNDIHKVYHSYSQAVILLQSSFFYEYNSILTDMNATALSSSVFTDPSSAFTEALSSKNKQEAEDILNRIFNYFKNNRSYLPNQVRDIYYKLFMIVQNSSKSQQVNAGAYSQIESILEYIENFQTLSELHKSLLQKIDDYFEAIDNQVQENSTIYMIKDFIQKNFMNDTLSVKDISEHVYLSTSYVCTLFKTETHQTLNQYITEYRMEKAKQLLSDPRYKITDISSKVGYSDGNYFSKSFKKIVGLSPSEYREKVLK